METATLPRHRPGPEVASGRVEEPPGRWPSRLPWVALVLLVAGATFAFFYWPTYPNYDSYYSLLWGRELLDGHLPSFEAYRAPTEHPLAVLFGVVLSPLGSGADRVMVFATYASFVGLGIGLYRLGRIAFTPLIGLFAGLVLCTRFDFPFLAARGYIDVPYLAFVIWAAALEAARPRRGTPVLVLLLLASMMRPEAWVLTGLYFLWVAWPATWRRRAFWAALSAAGPVVWVALDYVVTGDPTFSQTHTSGLAEELGRTRALSEVPAASAQFLKDLVKTPIFYTGALGTLLAVYLAPRRAAVPLALAVAGEVTFLMIGAAGLSVIFRYLLSASLMLMLFSGVTVMGWTMLERGKLRSAWIAAAGAAIVVAVVVAGTRTNFGSLEDQLKYRGEAHVALVDVLHDPAIDRGLACGPISTPNHKLIPDVRWIADRGEDGVLARSQIRSLLDPTIDRKPGERAEGRAMAQQTTTGVSLFVNNRTAILRQSLVDRTDVALDSVPQPGWVLAASNSYYAAYVKC